MSFEVAHAIFGVMPNTKTKIKFFDEEGHPQDGEFTITFTGRDLILQETAGLPGNVKGQAGEILYHEKFGDVDDGAALYEQDSKPSKHKRGVGVKQACKRQPRKCK